MNIATHSPIASELSPVRPAAVRYLKMGEGGVWAKRALAQGWLPFDFRTIPHGPCQAGDWETVRAHLQAAGKTPSKVSDNLREIKEFYEQGSECLWITFADGHLWWAFAESFVEWNATPTGDDMPRRRRVRGAWRCTSIHGQPLRFDALSSQLTQVGGYRQTICKVGAEVYLLQKINGEVAPMVQAAQNVRAQLVTVAAELIAGLHWADFETLVDLIFARGGWHRSSTLGANVADVDLVLEHPLTEERAFVQVKSKATQAVLNDYLDRFQSSGNVFQRFFFVCHSPVGAMALPPAAHCHVWAGQELAAVAVRAGLFDWLVARSR